MERQKPESIYEVPADPLVEEAALPWFELYNLLIFGLVPCKLDIINLTGRIGVLGYQHCIFMA